MITTVEQWGANAIHNFDTKPSTNSKGKAAEYLKSLCSPNILVQYFASVLA